MDGVYSSAGTDDEIYIAMPMRKIETARPLAAAAGEIVSPLATQGGELRPA